MICVHCSEFQAKRTSLRRLCWFCENNANICRRYKPVQRRRPAKEKELVIEHVQPAESATKTRPGSMERIDVLAERAMNKQELFHPGDKVDHE